MHVFLRTWSDIQSHCLIFDELHLISEISETAAGEDRHQIPKYR